MIYDSLKNIDFLWPENFMLMALVVAMIWLYVRPSRKRSAAFKVSSVQPFSVNSFKNRMRHLPFILRVLAVTLIIVALARPQRRNDQQQTQGEGIDIILCMDVSGSMGSRDILPSRMEVAKEVAEKFVMSRPVDRFGLVVFSGESFTQCPLTTDQNTVVTQIRTLESRRILKDGTVIGEGLATSVDRLSKSTAASRVIILLTDGKEDAPDTRLIDPLTALEIAKSKEVKIYAIGMGAVPAPGPVQADGSQNPAVDFIDEALLRRMADETGGRYFRAKDKEGLQNIYDQIDKLEKSKIDIISYKRYRELFFPFILIALGLLFVELVLRFVVFRKYP